jgi:bacillaene synthase trans-acting acyltransferase
MFSRDSLREYGAADKYETSPIKGGIEPRVMKKSVWMFPGQGAQYYQMGRDLFTHEPVFRELFERGDELAKPLINQSLIDVIYQERPNRFDPFHRLLYTHPALFVYECAMAELLKRRGLEADYLLGYSLGEYACLVVSGAAAFADVLTAIIKEAELTEYCSPVGGMLAVLDSVEIVERYKNEFRDCTIAARNFERNFIVSGTRPALARLQAFLKSAGVNTAELPVDYAFHSPDMDRLQFPRRLVLEQLSLGAPTIPIISSAQRGFLKEASVQNLQTATRMSLDLMETVRRLESTGEYLYVDLGPSGSMATAIKYILSKPSGSEFAILSSPFGHESENVRALIQRCNRYFGK